MKNLLIRLTVGLYEQDITADEMEHVQKWLAQGYLVKEENLYRLPSKYRAGTIMMTQGTAGFLQVVGANVRDLYIDEHSLLDAKHGDLVIAQRLLGKRGGPSAKVVEVIGKAESYSVAILALKDGHKAMLDVRNNYPAGVELTAEDLAKYAEGDLFKINNQNGEIMELLGNISDPKVDEKIVLAQFNKHDAFEDDVLALAQSFDKNVDASLYPDRKDLRDLPFCTIDPVTAKDFDDAICYIPEKNILYVAIADVSAYVEPFGPIDAEAIYRSFSIYLPHRSIPMLPRQLSETLCSLQPHVDRLSFVFEIHLDGIKVVHTELYEAIIHSKRRFSYEEVDAFFEGDLPAANSDEKAVMAYLPKLRELTGALKKERLKYGYDFHSEELEMELDENQMIRSTTTSEETPSHGLIEDCMLLANKAAANRYNHGVFRIHEQSSPMKLQSLYQELAGIGIIVEPKESMKETIDFIQAEAYKRDLVSEVDTLIIRAQMQARYAPDNVGHFGLGFDAYTHFTSPIRRYSDLIVHRHLKALLAKDTEESSYVLRNIDALCFSISEKEREASAIEVRFMQRKFARWANENIGKEFKARVNSTDPFFTAQILEPMQGAQVNLSVSTSVTLFDDIILRIDNVDLATARINAALVKKLDHDPMELS
ncbi:MAG: ribonuclease R [Helicobacteraceae bacterium]|nr:ribonuclease R [Helicobacteraceae bacterium]